MFVTNWISTTKIQKISEITNFFRHYFLSRTEVKEENRYRPLKKKEQSDLFPHSITSWASMTSPEWVDLGLRRKWKVIISMCLHLSRYPH